MKLKTFFILLVVSLLLVQCDKNDDTQEEPDPCNEPISLDLGDNKVLNEGESLVLDAGNEGASFQWSTGDTSQSITVDTSGTYWVKVSTCSDEQTDTVKVDMAYKTIAMETNHGMVRFWLYTNTPLHRNNFISLTESSFYNSLIFHRVVLNFVIQGGDPDGTGYGGPGYTIPSEIDAGNSHLYGAVGAARLADNVNPERESNGSQFYIVSDPNGEAGLNGNYTVFGQVFDGLEVVDEIQQVPVDGNSMPLEDVVMNAVSIEYFTFQQLEDQFGFIPSK